MKLLGTMAANLFLAGTLLAIPAFAAESNSESNTLASAPNTVALGDKDGGPGGEKHEWSHRPHMTDEQLERFAALRNQFIDSTTAQRTQGMALKRQLHTALAKVDVNRQEVLAIQSQINAVHSDLALKKMNFKLDGLAVLTPEQREHFRRHMLMANAFGGHHGHGGPGGCGGGGGERGHHHHGHGGGGRGRVGFEGPGGPGGPEFGGRPSPVGFEGPGAPAPSAEGLLQASAPMDGPQGEE